MRGKCCVDIYLRGGFCVADDGDDEMRLGWFVKCEDGFPMGLSMIVKMYKSVILKGRINRSATDLICRVV